MTKWSSERWVRDHFVTDYLAPGSSSGTTLPGLDLHDVMRTGVMGVMGHDPDDVPGERPV